MRRPSHLFLPLFFTAFFLVSCKTVYQPQAVQYIDYRLTQQSKQDSNLNKLLQPYADSVNKSMNTVIAVAATELEKKQPEGTLGNIMADAMMVKAKQGYKMPVDGAFINFGGIRLTSVAAGNITRGKIFELAPFDNDIVIQKLSGKVLQEFLNHISAKGGWPVAGISWQIKNLPAGQAGKAAINISINGQPINDTTVYAIAMVDYVANGGDDCIMLRPIPQKSTGYVLRDALIEYFIEINKEGKKISSQIENRVTNAE
jgi:2',3'-cyclic-nucleotide 2'-phosphodiesterase (5'-nucleotidase family)